MYFYLVIIAGVLAGIAYVAILRGKVKSLKLKLKSETERADKNAHVIKAMEVAFKNENEKKKKLHTGSDADKFNASLDILSNKAASKTS